MAMVSHRANPTCATQRWVNCSVTEPEPPEAVIWLRSRFFGRSALKAAAADPAGSFKKAKLKSLVFCNKHEVISILTEKFYPNFFLLLNN